MAYQPVIIIGAARSGTNMVRDVLTAFSGVVSWPCDEINYIWRHGNVRHPSDELTPNHASAGVRRYIRKQFDWVARHYGAHTVVEKTCANSLRIRFVDRIVPEARYIFLRRDGLDVVASAAKRWTADLDLPYLARKARFVPATDVPYYASRYLWNRIHRLISAERRLAFWGPRFVGMEDELAQCSLEEVCAIQWKRCVESSIEALAAMSPGKWLEVGYEALVNDPSRGFSRIAEFAGVDVDAKVLNGAVEQVTAASVGKGVRSLDESTLARVLPILEAPRRHFGYV